MFSANSDFTQGTVMANATQPPQNAVSQTAPSQAHEAQEAKARKFTDIAKITTLCLVFALMFATQVSADALTSILDAVRPLVVTMGGVVSGVGAVMFGLGFKNDDADSKTRGIQTMIGGAACVAAAAFLTAA